MGKELTFKQKLFIKVYFDSFGNATRAALTAYKCKNRNVAGVLGYQTLRLPNVHRVVDRILALSGVNDEAIAQRLRPYVIGGGLSSIELSCKLSGYKT